MVKLLYINVLYTQHTWMILWILMCEILDVLYAKYDAIDSEMCVIYADLRYLR